MGCSILTIRAVCGRQVSKGEAAIDTLSRWFGLSDYEG